jgi:hypothetical protein
MMCLECVTRLAPLGPVAPSGKPGQRGRMGALGAQVWLPLCQQAVEHDPVFRLHQVKKIAARHRVHGGELGGGDAFGEGLIVDAAARHVDVHLVQRLLAQQRQRRADLPPCRVVPVAARYPQPCRLAVADRGQRPLAQRVVVRHHHDFFLQGALLPGEEVIVYDNDFLRDES